MSAGSHKKLLNQFSRGVVEGAEHGPRESQLTVGANQEKGADPGVRGLCGYSHILIDAVAPVSSQDVENTNGGGKKS